MLNPMIKIAIIALVSGLAWGQQASQTETLRVVATIKPIHALVAGVMEGVGTPELLLTGATSPHDYSLRPSDVRRIQNAQVIFWVGAELETFLVKPIKNTKARSVELIDAPGVVRLPMREGGEWEPHHHHAVGHYHDHKHVHAQQHNHSHDDHNHAHDHHGDHDAHIWLSPQNAMAMVQHIRQVLSEMDSSHPDRYAVNATAFIQRLTELDESLKTQLAPISTKPYLVFHDAYQYFEQHYGLNAVGSIVVSPEQMPRAQRIAAIRKRIEDNQVVCVFSEPQFKPSLVNTLVKGTPAKTGVLDPLGADLTAGPEAYLQLLNNLAGALVDCLL